MAKTVKIFDTTLRDGEQSPGCSMNLNEKIEVARQLDAMGVDIIEAGFAIASPGDAAAIAAISDAVQHANKKRIHIFLATSPVHMEYKLKMNEEQVLESVRHHVAYAKNYCEDIEFSAEDATRSDPDFLCKVFETAIESGATTLNIPDTVGYVLPEEYAERVRYVREHVRGVENVTLSCHCHDDLGMAVANTLAGVMAGIHHQRHRRARGQCLYGRMRHGDAHPQGFLWLRNQHCHQSDLPRKPYDSDHHRCAGRAHQGDCRRKCLCA